MDGFSHSVNAPELVFARNTHSILTTKLFIWQDKKLFPFRETWPPTRETGFPVRETRSPIQVTRSPILKTGEVTISDGVTGRKLKFFPPCESYNMS